MLGFYLQPSEVAAEAEDPNTDDKDNDARSNQYIENHRCSFSLRG